jgi:hypothetical protein
MSELRVFPEDWNCLTPLIQMGINNSPRQSLGGFAPCQVHMGLPPFKPLEYLLTTPKLSRTILAEEFENTLADGIQRFVEARDQTATHLIQIVNKETDRRRKINERYHEHDKPQPIDLSVGDFVMLASPNKRQKLLSRWLGPYTITELLGSHVFRLKDLISGNLVKAHAARLRKYSNALLNSEASIKEQCAFYADNLTIDMVKGHKVVSGEVQLLISWDGFESDFDSYEPGKYIVEVASGAVQDYLSTLNAKDRAYLSRLLKM